MVVNIRLPKREDIKDILALERATHKGLGSKLSMSEDELVEWVGRERTRLYVAERAGGGVAGYLMVDASEADEAVVHRLTVAPDDRRQGVGLALLEMAEKVAKKALAPALVIYAYEQDLDTQQFLASCGLKATPVRRHYGNEGAYKFSLRLMPQKYQD